MKPKKPPQRDLVLIGGGHAHVQVVKMLRMDLPSDVRLTLISNSTYAYYSGMLPGCVAGIYSTDQIEVDLVSFCAWAGVRFIHDAVTGIDPVNKNVLFAERPPLGYDLASVNVGSTIRGEHIEGVREHAIATRPLTSFMDSLLTLDKIVEREDRTRLLIVGGGPAGWELSMSLINRYAKHLDKIKMSLLDSSQHVMSCTSDKVQKKGLDILSKKGVTLHLGQRASRVEGGKLHCESGEIIEFDQLVWATGAASHAFHQNCSLTLDDQGFFKVDEFLQTSDPDIFAAGDCISFPDPLEKAGVYSVREGPYLIHNLLARLNKESLKKYKPQKDFLRLMGTGDKKGLADWMSQALYGDFVWKWKNWIDLRWMDKFNPKIIDPEFFENAQKNPMRCAGCGAKVSSEILLDTLNEFKKTHAPVFDNGQELDDAAVINTRDGTILKTIDQLKAFVDDYWVFGRVCVLHSLSDIYAMGAKAEHVLAAVTVGHASERLQARDLKQLLGGVAYELQRAGVVLMGGHTSEGAEATVALSVTGRATEGFLSKGGAQVGDLLVLTKPLGIGIVLAAAMRAEAKGRWVEEVISAMLESNKKAGELFLQAGATAMTDVTGFGLAGHLREMADTSGVGIELIQDLPMFTGTTQCLEKKIESTLADPNRASMGTWNVNGQLPAVIYDPQTSGGLVATVPPEKLEGMKRLFDSENQRFWVVGQVTGQSQVMSMRLR